MRRLLRSSLSELSDGSASRAAGIIVVAHLLPGLVMLGLWLLGLLPVFDGGLRWVLRVIAVGFGSVALLGLVLWFGFWGTPGGGDQASGEEYTDTFGPRIGFALGWLRWFMQLVAAALALVAAVMIWMNLRMWHFTGTEELRALPARFERIPVPDEWTPVGDVDASRFGIRSIVSWPDGDRPNGHVQRRYSAPASYTHDDLRRWMTGPDWTTGASPFGAIQVEACSAEDEPCDARLVPRPGGEPEYFISADLRTEPGAARRVEILLRLQYWKHTPPDHEVSDETVERARLIPVPSDWVRHTVVTEGKSNSGERFTQWYTVPDTTTERDIRAWLAGPQWTSPATGRPFGRITVDSCQRVDGLYRCEASVVRADPSSRPIESISVMIDETTRVRVRLERTD